MPVFCLGCWCSNCISATQTLMKSSTTAFNSTFSSWHRLQFSGDIQNHGQVYLPTLQRHNPRRALLVCVSWSNPTGSANVEASRSPQLDWRSAAHCGCDGSRLTASTLFLLFRREAGVDILQNKPKKKPFSASAHFSPSLFIKFVLLLLPTRSRLIFGQSKWLTGRMFMLLTCLLAIAIYYDLQMQNGIVILQNTPEIANATEPRPVG